MARTVRDAALLLSVMAGPDPRCPISIEQPGSRFAKPLDRDFRGVRVAWFHNLSPRDGVDSAIFDPRIVAAVNAQRKTFENLGCVVEEIEPDWRCDDEAYHTFRAWGYSVLAAGNSPLKASRSGSKTPFSGRSNAGRGSPAPTWSAPKGYAPPPGIACAFSRRPTNISLRPARRFRRSSPICAAVTEIAGVKMNTYIDWMKCCYFISMLECPSMSVPCGFTPEGLPVGLQIVGRHRDEFAVLQLAHAFESVTVSARRAPPL